MSVAEPNEIGAILDRVQTWPPAQRIILARKILESLEAPASVPTPTLSAKRGHSAVEVRNLLTLDRPAPDDETVRRWIDEHRMEKYG